VACEWLGELRSLHGGESLLDGHIFALANDITKRWSSKCRSHRSIILFVVGILTNVLEDCFSAVALAIELPAPDYVLEGVLSVVFIELHDRFFEFSSHPLLVAPDTVFVCVHVFVPEAWLLCSLLLLSSEFKQLSATRRIGLPEMTRAVFIVYCEFPCLF